MKDYVTKLNLIFIKIVFLVIDLFLFKNKGLVPYFFVVIWENRILS